MARGLSALRRSLNRDRSNSPKKSSSPQSNVEDDDIRQSSSRAMSGDDNINSPNRSLSPSSRRLVSLASNSDDDDDDDNGNSSLFESGIREDDAISCNSETTPKIDNTTGNIGIIIDNHNDNDNSMNYPTIENNTEQTISNNTIKNNKTTPTTSTSSPPSSKNNVTFAADKDDVLLHPPPSTTSPQHLISTLQRLRDEISQNRIDLSAEKALRKKKEKNLIKLAKQLNARSSEIKDTQTQLSTVTLERDRLSKDLSSYRRQIDDLSLKRDRDAQKHHEEMERHAATFRKMSLAADYRLEELRMDHARRCEELRAQVLTSQLEADRLRGVLAAIEMAGDPGGAEGIVRRVVKERSGMVGLEGRSGAKRRWYEYQPWGYYSLVGLVIVGLGMVLGVKPTFSPPSIIPASFCGPLVPYVKLSSQPQTTVHNEAPWWAPASMKQRAFELVCANGGGSSLDRWQQRRGGRPRTRIALSTSGMTLSRLRDETMVGGEVGGEGDVGEVFHRQWKVKGVILEGTKLVLTSSGKNKGTEVIDAPWV